MTLFQAFLWVSSENFFIAAKVKGSMVSRIIRQLGTDFEGGKFHGVTLFMAFL